jgi:Flp pilus assembly protein CpaB
MNSLMLRILACVLALGAIVVGYLGYQISRQPPKPAPAAAIPAPSVNGTQVLFAAREIVAGRAITAEDVVLAPVPQRPARAFAYKEAVIGKMTGVAIAPGEMLLVPHFVHKSPLARTVRPGERAVAIQVDEAGGTGGFVEPGDEVDVLLYLRADKETAEHSSAQIVLRKVRVLAFGNMLETPLEDGTKTGAADTAKAMGEKVADKKEKTGGEEPTGKKSKTAVLAVPEEDTSRLMLAESSGKLRLALYGVQEDAPTPTLASSKISSPGENNHFLVLEQLLQRTAPVNRQVTNRPVRAPVTGHRVIVYKGDTVEVISPSS